jgi:hypothetical protein
MTEVNEPVAALDCDEARHALRKWIYVLLIAVAASTAFSRIVTVSVWYSPARWPRARPAHTPFFSANDRSRWDTVWSLVERGTYQIDDIIQRPGWDTIDKVRKEGHFYSTKPPLLATLAAGLYWGIKQTTGMRLDAQPHEVAQLILLLINWLPMVVSLLVLSRIVERYARTDWARLVIVATAAFGTFLSTFLITFNNHTVAAHSLMFALAPTLAILVDGSRSARMFALAGFFAAFVVCNELPAALFGLALFVLFVRIAPRETCLWFVPAALVPLAGFFITNYLATGGIMPFYAAYGTKLYEYVFQGMPSYWMAPQGIDRNLDPWWAYLFHCLVGHHGILSLSPVFCLTVWGWLKTRRYEPAGLRTVSWLSLGMTLAVLTFYLLRPSNYNYGGLTSGLRWTFWLIPLWLISMIPALDSLADRRWFRWTCVALVAVSIVSCTIPNNNPWQHPWLFNLFERAGWINYNR